MSQKWRIADDQMLILNIGRVCWDKGIVELLNAISLAVARDPRIICVVLGSMPAFDETTAVYKKVEQTPGLREHVRFLPA